MHHFFIDRFSRGVSPLHRLDPRAKVLFFLPLVVLINLTPIGWAAVFAGCASLLVVLTLVARVPLGYLAKRLLIVLPFVLVVILFLPFMTPGTALWRLEFGRFVLVVTREGLLMAANVLAKALLCVFSLLLLVSTTRFDHLLRALGTLRVPRVILIILSFLYRYLFILIDEVLHMKRARDARSVNPRRVHLRAGAGIAGVLFVRTYERSERVYQAMTARGFDGEVRALQPFHFKLSDGVALAGGWAVVALIWWAAWVLG